jgi:hypothetical protein
LNYKAISKFYHTKKIKLMRLITIIVFFTFQFPISAFSQNLCPGGGSNFASAVFFSPSWTQGCGSNSSCSGGTDFDNRNACEPLTPMDGCAPAPSTACAPNISESDIWFKFYATSTTATINIVQGVSFYATIQAFSGSPSCSNLVSIGCAKANGPSQGVSLVLSGLTAGQLYHFRIFGNANNASQRTGTFCFCGSTGMSDMVLPISIEKIEAFLQGKNTLLKWRTQAASEAAYFEIEKSIDGEHFSTINKIVDIKGRYQFEVTDVNPTKSINFYRIKEVHKSGSFEYSKIVSVNHSGDKKLLIYPNPARDMMTIESAIKATVVLMNMQGAVVDKIELQEGNNIVPLSNYTSGLYFIRSINDNKSFRLNIVR